MGTLEQGSRNAVRVCMGLNQGENVLIVSDQGTEAIGRELARQSEIVTGPERVKLVLLEDHVKRPMSVMPIQITDLASSWADVTFWAARSLPGELVARRDFLDVAKVHARHGHMPNVTIQLMEQGMCSDYDQVYELTHKVYDTVKGCGAISVSNRFGTSLRVEFDPNWRWVPSDGRYHSKGKWGNLPEGETFTAPKHVEGKLVTNLLGDWFSEKYGNFKDPLSLRIENSRMIMDSIECKNSQLKSDIKSYLATEENSTRASEFALPTNPLLMSLPTVGNLLQDEKARVHIAFGDPYQAETGAPWKCKTHVDMLLEQCDVSIEGKGQIMKHGKYTF
ncbi:MAG TPA: aminopeptidase [Nitrososphaerales archaeon]|nr:aminopeptidase [Nitrososphaerales archaeon]